MAGTEALENILLNWKSLVLILYVLGIGYIGLFYIYRLKGKEITKLNLFDKVIRSAILGFVSFLLILSFKGIKTTDESNIFTLIDNFGLGIFLLTVIVCVGISFMLYAADHIFKKESKIKRKKVKREKVKKK